LTVAPPARGVEIAMTTRKLVSAFACGLVVGLLVASVAAFALRQRGTVGGVPPGALDEETLPRARVREEHWEDPPQIRLEHDAEIDRAGAWTLGTPRDDTRELHFGAIRMATRPGLVAFKFWEGNGLTGTSAMVCLGPERNDVRVRVAAFGDVGPPFERPWQYVNGRIQLSDWPPDRPGSLIAFEFEGQLGREALAFSGKFRIPTPDATGEFGPEGVRLIVDESREGASNVIREPPLGVEATAERVAARPEVQAFRYRETTDFGGVQATFSFGPGLNEVQARVDDLSDAGPPESWSALRGRIWRPATPLDVSGAWIDFELFGFTSSGPRRFAAKFLTPPVDQR